MLASWATSWRRRPSTRRGLSVSGSPTVRGLSSERRFLRNSPSSLRGTLLVMLSSMTPVAPGEGGRISSQDVSLPGWISPLFVPAFACEARYRAAVPDPRLRFQTLVPKEAPNHARSSHSRPWRRALRDPGRPGDHPAHRRDHPYGRHLRVRLGPVALPRRGA